MSQPAPQPVNEAKLHEFVMKAVGEMGAAMNAALIIIGDKLGLYKAMAGAGPMTSAEVAAKTKTTERYVREWLSAQAAGGFVTYDEASGKFTLPPEQTMALADRSLCSRRLETPGSGGRKRESGYALRAAQRIPSPR